MPILGIELNKETQYLCQITRNRFFFIVNKFKILILKVNNGLSIDNVLLIIFGNAKLTAMFYMKTPSFKF